MTTDTANTMIVTSLALSGTLVVVRDARAGHPPPVRLFVGLTAAGVALATLAQFWPQMGGGLAALIALSSIFVYGGPAMEAITSGATAGPVSTTATDRIGIGGYQRPTGPFVA